MFVVGEDPPELWHGEQGVHGELLHGLEGDGLVLPAGLGLWLVAEPGLQGGAGGQSGSSPLPQPVPLLWLLLLLLQDAHVPWGPNYHSWWRSRSSNPSPPCPLVLLELGAS